MMVERGFRRVLIVLSVLLVVGGIAADWLTAVPHATVLVTLKDGRQFTLERDAGPLVMTSPHSLAYQLQTQHGVYPERLSSEVVAIIADARITHGPAYQWRTITTTTQVAVLLILLLWLAFYVLRWIVRGFGGV